MGLSNFEGLGFQCQVEEGLRTAALWWSRADAVIVLAGELEDTGRKPEWISRVTGSQDETLVVSSWCDHAHSFPGNFIHTIIHSCKQFPFLTTSSDISINRCGTSVLYSYFGVFHYCLQCLVHALIGQSLHIMFWKMGQHMQKI